MAETVNFETVLCELAFRYGTDKCPQIFHPYTPFYFDLFNGVRDSVRKVLEIGVGGRPHQRKTNRSGFHYAIGASLFMWRDFFPLAQVYGADIDPRAMVEGDRVKTTLCDQGDEDSLHQLVEWTGRDLDIVVDDAAHLASLQVLTCRTLMPLLPADVVYIIEDVMYPRAVLGGLTAYDCSLKDFGPKGSLMVVRNK